SNNSKGPAQGKVKDGLYQFDLNNHQFQSSVTLKGFSSSRSHDEVSFSLNKAYEFDLRHQRLGHVSRDVVKKALEYCNVLFVINEKASLCSSCVMSKSHRLPYSHSSYTTSEPLELIHSDLRGPTPIKSRNGYS
ncbi:Uncharacterized mitochondrial protein AtMg00300, partial [Striga hermonthica]